MPVRPQQFGGGGDRGFQSWIANRHVTTATLPPLLFAFFVFSRWNLLLSARARVRGSPRASGGRSATRESRHGRLRLGRCAGDAAGAVRGLHCAAGCCLICRTDSRAAILLSGLLTPCSLAMSSSPARISIARRTWARCGCTRVASAGNPGRRATSSPSRRPICAAWSGPRPLHMLACSSYV